MNDVVGLPSWVRDLWHRAAVEGFDGHPPLYSVYDDWWNDASAEMREAAGMKPHAWTCTACNTPCTLVLVTDISKFMSSCCTAPVRQTKEEGMKYRKLPVEVYAKRYTGPEALDDLVEFTRPPHPNRMVWFMLKGAGRAEVYDVLHRTWVELKPGDWVIKGVQGEFYPCTNEVFEQTYEAVL